MKRYKLNSLILACVAFSGACMLSSCTSMLQEEHETSYTTSYVTSDADGLKLMTAALYPYERNSFATGYANNELMNLLNRYGDIVCCSVNHRLNSIGYSDLAKVGGEKYAETVYATIPDEQLENFRNATSILYNEIPDLPESYSQSMGRSAESPAGRPVMKNDGSGNDY